MKIVPISAIILIMLASCMASRTGIVRSYGYSQASFPGIVTEEDRHKGPDTLYLVYLESKKDTKPTWTTGYFNDKTYNLIVSMVSSPANAGLLKETGDSAIMAAGFGNILYQLSFEENRNSPAARTPSGKKNVLVIRKNTSVPEEFIEINTIKELVPALHM